jgi:hypothetical protein
MFTARSLMMRYEKCISVLTVFVVISGIFCSSGQRLDKPARIVENVPDLDIPPAGDPFGHAKPSAKAVYLFSQGGASQTDSQVLEFSDAILIRGWQKWDREGVVSSDYDFSFPAASRAKGIGFVAGGTASVVFRDENPAGFDEWATRDAKNEFVEHDYIVAGAHRASLANPEYRDYLVSFCKAQIDGGVDGVFLDEANAGYNGGRKWSWNGNEGYDDYFLAGFNAYLMKLHTDYSQSDWINRYGMSATNVIRKDAAPGDLANNFNYRVYLNDHGWGEYPDNPANPLAPLWGKIEGNRPNPSATSFRERALIWYWRDIVSKIRGYARKKYGKEILITSNGIFPFVDFNSFGMYNYNKDYQGGEVAWVPVVNGHLNGSISLKNQYIAMRERHKSVAGNVPLVMFIDWPTGMMNSYYDLPLAEKKDFWRIFAAEAYACGIYYAFHLKTSMPNEPTASAQSVLDFMKTYTAFYRDNAVWYTAMTPTDIAVTTGDAQITATVSSSGRKYCLHLVNHNYSDGLITKTNFTVSFPVKGTPKKATLFTPDSTGTRDLPITVTGGIVKIQVDELVSYDMIVVK